MQKVFSKPNNIASRTIFAGLFTSVERISIGAAAPKKRYSTSTRPATIPPTKRSTPVTPKPPALSSIASKAAKTRSSSGSKRKAPTALRTFS